MLSTKKTQWRNFPGFSGPLNRCGPAMYWGSPKLCFIGKIGRAGYCFKLAFIGIPKVAVGFGTDPIWTRPKKGHFYLPAASRQPWGKLITSTCSRETYRATTAILVVTPDFCYGNHVSISWFDCFLSTISPSLSTFWWGWVKESRKRIRLGERFAKCRHVNSRKNPVENDTIQGWYHTSVSCI